MSAHTPGPWHRNIPPATKYTTIFAGRNTHVARLSVDGLPAAEVEANCNLIAAAPDLLAALQRLTHPAADEEDLENALELLRVLRNPNEGAE
jgi:hypothetical protein